MAMGAFADQAVSSLERAQSSALEIAVFSSLAEAEAVWRDLETRAVLTPYQRFDWVDQYCRSGFEVPGDVAIAAISERGKTIALLPLTIKRRLGVAIASVIGMPISNTDALIYDPANAASLDREALVKAFAAIGRSGRALDLVSLHCLMPDWQGHSNPLLAFDHARAPNNLYVGRFDAGAQPYIEQSLPHKRRSNIRRSMRRLEEMFGDIEVRHARTPAEIETAHTAFVAQRAKRFEQMGVENVFASAPFQSLFQTLALKSLDMEKPIFRYHALYAGNQILATSLGLYTDTHYSQYINSTTDGPASKYTLMGVMLSSLVDELRAGGIQTFDMGLGDFEYKTDWTDPMTVFDAVIPVSATGALAAPALRGARAAKRLVKQTPALWNLTRKLLALKTRVKGTRGA